MPMRAPSFTPERDRVEDHLRRKFEADGLGSQQVRHWTKATGGGAWDASRYRGFGRAMLYCGGFQCPMRSARSMRPASNACTNPTACTSTYGRRNEFVETHR